MRAALLALIVACSSEPERCAPPCLQPIDVIDEQLEPARGDLLLELGDTTNALALYQRVYDRVLRAHGDNHPVLADAIDKLAAAKREQGKLRDAMRLHDRAIDLRVAAFGASDIRVAHALLERAKTLSEAGELAAARRDLDAAARLGVTPVTRAAVFDGPLTVTNAPLLAARVRELVAAHQLDAARTLAADMRSRLLPDRNPKLAAEVGAALLAVGDRTAAAAILAKAAAMLGNEPSRTALQVFVHLARASDANAAQAARTAISLYQAMPQLDRADHDEMWIIARR
jgi:tetratricopeptide (TPR) repeat protein